MTEVWKDVKGYEGLYQVSNLGRVKSLARILNDGRKWKEKVLKLGKDKDGYLQVHLYKNGKPKMFKIYRLVAEAFIPNPDSLPCVNHKDEDKTNNTVENLEWCTHEYNVNYGVSLKKRAKTQHETGVQINNKGTSKAVYQYTTNGLILNVYPSIHEVKRIYNFDDSCIVKCCRGKYNHAYGYKWSYTLLFPPAVIPMS